MTVAAAAAAAAAGLLMEPGQPDGVPFSFCFAFDLCAVE